MEEIYKKLGEPYFNLWGKIQYTNKEDCEVTELWLHHESATIRPKDRTVPHASLDGWLDTQSKGTGRDAETLIARFVWVDIDGPKLDLSKSVQSNLLARFGLKLANDYSRSCVTGITALPPASTPHANQQAYSLSYAPKLAAIWSHSRFRPPMVRPSVTEAIIFAREKQKKQLRTYLNLSTWRPELSSLAMFPAFMISIMLGYEVNETHEDIKNRLREVETRTGFHNFASREEAVEKGDPLAPVLGSSSRSEELGTVSEKTSGFATKLASTGRKSKTLEKLLDFIVRKTGDSSPRQHSGHAQPSQLMPPTEQVGCDLLTGHVAVLKDRLEFQNLDAEYTSKRISIQIDALFNLITQQDSIASINLTKSTAKIAFFSYQDSSSMKTLAVVTMFFLPGSFISALFSTPCFDWDRVDLTERDNIGVPSTPQFLLYWAITIPMTFLTFVLYFLWLWFHHKRLDEKFQKEQAGQEKSSLAAPHESEGDRTARVRRETLVDKKGW